MNWHITYYNEKIRKEIDKMPVSIRASFARITELIIEFGPSLPMPYVRPMKNGLFEIRAKGKVGIGRIFYCTIKGKKIVILHSFIKKSQKTPIKELNIARKRMKEVKSENA